ncbi:MULTISPECIES: hypothetical protein [unclassified Streptomyces]|uniref:hypothetical protein n=1 Tax=unclassified Streptomyces TaxID=2593676 RepID=UPI0015A37F24|nr:MULTISPECIES: hypothetical protein [unclassified Streptomyces]
MVSRRSWTDGRRGGVGADGEHGAQQFAKPALRSEDLARAVDQNLDCTVQF